MIFESNVRNHCTSRNEGLAAQPVYLYPNETDYFRLYYAS